MYLRLAIPAILVIGLTASTPDRDRGDEAILHKRGPSSPTLINDSYGAHVSTTIPLQTIHGWVNDGAFRSGSGLRGYGEGRCPQYQAIAIQAGWSQGNWPTVSRLMYAESLCITTARNPNSNGRYGHARGLMQIMDGLWPNECGITADQLYDPLLNLQCALHIWHQQGWEAWATY